MERLSRSVLISLGVWALGSACSAENGNGLIATQERSVATFSKVKVEDGLQVSIGRGERLVSITTDENLMSFIDVEVDGETLELRRNSNTQPTSIERIEVTTNVLTSLEVKDNSQVSADATQAGEWRLTARDVSVVSLTNIETSELDIDASDESRVDAFGNAIRVRIEAKSRSQVNTDGVTAEDVKVDASGGSLVFVNARSKIEVDASGNSFITVSGNPQDRNIDANGGSTVTFSNDRQ